MHSFKSSLALVLCLATTATHASAADSLRGAAAILEQVNARNGDEAAKVDKPPSAAAKLRIDLSNFTARASTLMPSEAAKEWLALGDRQASIPMRFNPAEEQIPPPQFAELITSLPPPAAWDELAKAIAARPAPDGLKNPRELALRMLGSALAGDRGAIAKQAADFDALLLKMNPQEAMSMIHLSRSLNDALLAMSDDPKAILAGVERQLSDAERGRNYGFSSVNLPDLVGIVGEAAATPVLERALKSKAQNFSVTGKATEALASKLALKLINELQVPRWELVNSLDAVELYEALDKKFSQAKPAAQMNPKDALAELEDQRYDNNYSKNTARTYYLMGLIVHNRAEDAAKFARGLKDTDAGSEFQIAAGEAALSRAGFMNELDEFLFKLLSQNPELPFWEAYFNAAARAGTTERMLKLARATAANPNLGQTKKGSIRENLYRALLAADLVDEGVKELRALLASAPKSAAPGAAGIPVLRSARQIDWQSHALTLARIGHLLEKPEWVNEGIAAAMPKPEAPSADDEFSSAYQTKNLIDLLVQVGRLGEAEKLLADQLAKGIKQAARQPGYMGMGRSPAAEPLKMLVSLYHRAERHADVLLLLDQSPNWGVKDLADFVKPGMAEMGMDFDLEGFGGGHFSKGTKGNPLLKSAASALVNAGRKVEARGLVDAMLDQAPGDDRAYELLIQIAGQGALPKLDAVFARDQFEERPLIWKALLLHQAGQEEAAEKIARQAIAIDPSDGEEGKNDRMRVYAVLADIREARGDQKEAAILRGAVRAIRLSERADDFYATGLLSRAVKMYEESLTHFTDAYCIQSRLAVQLSALGDHELAMKHYEKAFQLMPESFGRVESHCFGCEGAFNGAQAQGVAERVFTALAVKTPDKPQVHYLLGYLRQQQGRGKEAVPHFRKALQLDPEYLNAWEHLEQLSHEHRLPSAERDAIAFNILRLDPLGRHASANLREVGDLRKLWAAVDVASKFRVKPPTTLLPLAGSRSALEKQERETKNQPNRYNMNYYSRVNFDEQAATAPGAAIAGNQLINAIAQWASGAGGMMVE